MQEWLGMPVPAAAHAGDVDQIMSLVHWLMLALFVGWSAFFAFVLVRFRRSSCRALERRAHFRRRLPDRHRLRLLPSCSCHSSMV
jgi:heme/copper-type cytochrome/quinol oxidase subunit 2